MNIIKNLNFQNFLKISFLIAMIFSGGLMADEIEWIAIGDLQSWYSNSGSEIEVGRTYKTDSQQDGLQWPAQFSNQDNAAAKAIWIGCTNYDDPFAGRPYPYKVVHVGPRAKDDVNEFMPQVFKMVGKFEHPLVTVDGLGATELDFLETVNEVDPNLVSDRMLVNIVNTGMGITMTRKIYAWSQQYNSNYFIYEYVFKNTGIYDKDGSTHNLTLTDVLFHWQYRYAVAKEACAYGGFWLPQSATWGANTMNDQTNPNAPPRVADGYLPARPDTPLRTLFSWNGKHDGWSTSLTNSGTNIGGPEHDDDGHLGASQFVGTVVLYADDPNNIGIDSPDQPFSTVNIGSDVPETKGNDQFNESKMTSEYVNFMDKEWPDPIHADAVGQGFATGGANAGGSSQTHTFGKYTMAPGDSVRIVIAEAVAGLGREHHYSVGENWLDWATGGSGPYEFPPSIAGNNADGDAYKNAWVFTGVDSLFQTFERAKDNYDTYLSQGSSIPTPPPPPLEFQVNTGGDRIILTWANNAESDPNFAGYNIYRAKFKPDTTFDLIQTINGPGVNVYEDLSPQRGFDYYYYITAFDNGSTNIIQPGVPLESSQFYTKTSEPAFLKRPAGTKLADIRIVPNPYNIRAREIQFGANSAGEDRIMFYNIPKVCRIKIFTERGDLVNTIDHIDGSGDQEWKQLTSSRQVVVSGLYIAHIEVIEDQYDDETNQLVLKKGDSIIKKFVIIR
jgi:hypothetical protein